jgi:hypothetical protein
MDSAKATVNQFARQRGKPWCRGFSVLVLFLGSVPLLQAANFSTSLDRNVVPMGETVTLNLIFDGVSPSAPPTLPQLPNLKVGQVGQSSQFTIDNGQQTSRITISYTLIPTQTGDVVIPSMQVVAAGRTLASQPLPLKIIPGTAGAGGATQALTNLAFVRLVVRKPEVYVGEPFPVEIHLYWQAAEDIRMPQLRAEGFSLGQMPQPSRTRTQVGNAIYDLAVFRMTATAARSGTLNLGPVEENLKVLVPLNPQRQSRDPFDVFFGRPTHRPYQTTLTSEVVPIRVLSLPSQGVPESFSGAIGSYQLSVNAGPTNLAVGDPITVRIQIAGSGPLDALTFPPQPHWRDFTSYPPTAKTETQDELGLAGSKTFEQVLVPQNHEIKLLPPVQFTFFDPAAKSYRTLTGPAIPLVVRPSATAVAPTLGTNLAAASAPPADDIIHIKARMEPAITADTWLVKRPWFLLLQGVPALCWLSLLGWRRRRESLANNPRLRRQREVAVRIRDGLKELRAQAERRQGEEFFANLFRLLQEQLGERLNLPASAITEAVIDEHLRSRKLGENTLQALHELFQTCNLARYASAQSSQELVALVPRVETVLRDLQQLPA